MRKEITHQTKIKQWIQLINTQQIDISQLLTMINVPKGELYALIKYLQDEETGMFRKQPDIDVNYPSIVVFQDICEELLATRHPKPSVLMTFCILANTKAYFKEVILTNDAEIKTQHVIDHVQNHVLIKPLYRRYTLAMNETTNYVRKKSQEFLTKRKEHFEAMKATTEPRKGIHEESYLHVYPRYQDQLWNENVKEEIVQQQ